MARADACPACGNGPVTTIDTRVHSGRRVRRKACGGCGHRWSTAEIPLDRDETHRVLLNALDDAATAVNRAQAAIDALLGPHCDTEHQEPRA